MRLFYRPQTGRPFRVAWALEELGVPYDAVAVSAQEAGSPDHLARHPLGRVPVLELDDAPSGDHGGATLFDSTAIVLQLADLFAEGGLIGPLGSLPRGLAYQWCLTAQTELEKAATNALRSYDVPAQREGFAAGVQAFADALDGHDFLVADSFGVADIVFGGVLLVGGRAGLVGGSEDVAGDRVLAYLDALKARPGFGQALARTESLFRDVV